MKKICISAERVYVLRVFTVKNKFKKQLKVKDFKKMSNPVSLIIIGAGGRGTGYANLIKALGDRATVTAVAEPRDFQRNRIGDMFNIPEERRFRCWSEVAKLPKFAFTAPAIRFT